MFRLSKVFRTLTVKCTIDDVCDDIFLEQIFSYTAIEDIIALRRVNRRFYILTHHPVVWKRILRQLNIPVAPLRPTYFWGEKSHNYEPEMLVSRAISLDDNWKKSPAPAPNEWFIHNDHFRVLELKLLPGGKYMLAAVRYGSKYGIALYSSDHPCLEANIPLCLHILDHRPYNIQAKYVKHNGVKGIMILFLESRWTNPDVPLDAAQYYKCRIELPARMTYYCITGFLSLADADLLANRYLLPGSGEFEDALKQVPLNPIQEVMSIFLEDIPFDDPTLFTKTDKQGVTTTHASLICFKGGRDEISILDLSEKTIATIEPRRVQEHSTMYHRIKSHRVLPIQNQVLVIRELLDHHDIQYVIELYNLPKRSEDFQDVDAFDRVFINDKIADRFIITDPFHLSGDDHPTLRSTNQCPPPISIFMRTVSETDERNYTDYAPYGAKRQLLSEAGISHYTVAATTYPEDNDTSDRIWVYPVDFVVQQSTVVIKGRALVLPGSDRSILCVMPENSDERHEVPKITAMRRYINPRHLAREYPHPEPDMKEPLLGRERISTPGRLYSTFQIAEETLAKLATEGVSTIDYDEGIGRVCLVSAREPTKIRVLDFSRVIHEDAERRKLWETVHGSKPANSC
ncbi:hypothetical protein C8J56DRAFT_325480 [Mycena floridula]|nr:hypothetical protein C8J56DRAFT_325480 [Mycena floridula]